jgi:peptidoglycan/LPS O-acetylase OafA/YrhL
MAQKTVSYLNNLTSIRGIGAVMVVIVHSNLFLFPLCPAGKTFFFKNAYILVDVFFVMSGFVISHVYNAKFSDGMGLAPFKKYMGARFARVYPIYFFTTFWAFAAALLIIKYSAYLPPLFATLFNVRALPATLLLIQDLHLYLVAPLNTPAWSLSAEWWMYLIFPVLVPLFLSLKTRGKIITAVLLLVAYVAMYYLLGPIARPLTSGNPSLDLISDFGFLRCAAGFLSGMLFYEFYRSNTGHNLLKNDWVFILCLASIFLIMHFNVNILFAFALLPVLILAASYNDTYMSKIFNIKPLLYLGEWSFSIYMIHIPILFTVYVYMCKRHPTFFITYSNYMSSRFSYSRAWLVCLMWVGITIAVSAFTYNYIEVPARNFLNKLFNTQRRKVIPEELKP